MAIIMTSGRITIFTRRLLKWDEEEAIRDTIKAYIQDICDGVADVEFRMEDSLSLSDDVGREQLWKRGFEPDILDAEEVSG